MQMIVICIQYFALTTVFINSIALPKERATTNGTGQTIGSLNKIMTEYDWITNIAITCICYVEKGYGSNWYHLIYNIKDWKDTYINYKNYNMKFGWKLHVCKLAIGTMEKLSDCETVLEINV